MAQQIREKMLQGMKQKRGEEVQVADIPVAFDSAGKIMKLNKVNPDKMIASKNMPVKVVKAEVSNVAKKEIGKISQHLKQMSEKKIERKNSGNTVFTSQAH